MKKLKIILLGLLLSTIAFGVDKAIKSSGDLILDSGSKIIIKKEIQTEVASPGFIPIGGMIAVMPNVAGSWQPPSSGVVKDGFMRADGATVSDAESPLNGQALPIMTGGAYPRGNTVSGATGGANTVKIASNNLPTHDHTIAHTHGVTGTAAGQTLGTSNKTSSSDSHYHLLFRNSDANYGTNPTSSNYVTTWNYPIAGSSKDYIMNASSTVAANVGRSSSDSHTHTTNITHTHAASSVSGSTNSQSSSTSGNGGFANDDINNEPNYVDVIWVIRVK